MWEIYGLVMSIFRWIQEQKLGVFETRNDCSKDLMLMYYRIRSLVFNHKKRKIFWNILYLQTIRKVLIQREGKTCFTFQALFLTSRKGAFISVLFSLFPEILSTKMFDLYYLKSMLAQFKKLKDINKNLNKIQSCLIKKWNQW